jgi:hypothetical protein
MKQGRQARGGRRRQEVAKACRRRRPGEASPSMMPLPRAGRRCRGRNLKGGAVASARFGARSIGRSVNGRTLEEVGSSREEVGSHY